MNKSNLAAALFLFLCVPLFCAFSPADQTAFGHANQLYRDSQFKEASEAYEAVIAESSHSAKLFYNLGNSYFRLDETGKAILAYERALRLSPRERDVWNNLNYLRDLQEYRSEDKRDWYIKTGDALLRHVTAAEVNLFALLMYFGFIFGCVFVVFYRRSKPSGWGRKAFFIFTIIGIALCAAKNIQVHVIRDAIVMKPESEVRYGPSLTDQVAFRLAEGMTVYVVKKRDKWSRVLMKNGESGWIRNKDVEEVWFA